MTTEPTYEDIDEGGEPTRAAKNKLMEDALSPKTPLQAQLLSVTRNVTRFSNTADRARWRKLEPKGSGPEQQLRIAWLKHCIEWGKKKGGKMPYTSVISYAENKSAEAVWIAANKSKILRKKSVGEVKEVLEAKEAELDALYNED